MNPIPQDKSVWVNGNIKIVVIEKKNLASERILHFG